MLTDTGSLMYEIRKLKTFVKISKKRKTLTLLFDFSTYPKDSKYYKNVNNLVVGKMKDETWSLPIKGFLGLNLKSIYS